MGKKKKWFKMAFCVNTTRITLKTKEIRHKRQGGSLSLLCSSLKYFRIIYYSLLWTYVHYCDGNLLVSLVVQQGGASTLWPWCHSRWTNKERAQMWWCHSSFLLTVKMKNSIKSLHLISWAKKINPFSFFFFFTFRIFCSTQRESKERGSEGG